jgi:hypothetical protein
MNKIWFCQRLIGSTILLGVIWMWCVSKRTNSTKHRKIANTSFMKATFQKRNLPQNITVNTKSK